MGCGYLNLYPMIASEKMAMGFHSFYPHGIGGTDLSQSHSHQIHSHHHHVRIRKHFNIFIRINTKKFERIDKYDYVIDINRTALVILISHFLF